MQGWVVFAAAYNIGLGIFHLLFWRLFGWPDSLRPSGQVNMAITQTLNLMLSYGFFALAIGLIWATAMDGPALPGLAVAGCGFWVIRASLQPLGAKCASCPILDRLERALPADPGNAAGPVGQEFDQ